MKKILLLLIIAISGCETKNVQTNSTNIEINGSNLETYIIDSCEYIGVVYSGSGSYLSHKGNCKNCLKRNK